MIKRDNKILKFAHSLPDFRMNRKKIHSSETIVFITIAAVICGADTWDDIEEFGIMKKEFLKEIIDLKHGIPSHDTINRFFSGLKSGIFEKHFLSWVQDICKNIKGVVAIDGKTIRGSRKEGNKSAIHMVSAFASANNLVLGQIKTDQKSNEITAIPELLKILDIEGCTVTIDAMGCQTKIAESILEQKADYILAVKENQKELYSNIIDSFRFISVKKQKKFEDIDSGHGRVETRICTVIDDLNHITKLGSWKNLKTIVKIDSERFIKATSAIQKETRYYISNLEANPQLIGLMIRNHWCIENKLHWQLDVSFNEDKSRKRYLNAAENFSVILRMALNLIKNEKSSKRSVRGKRLKAGWDNQYLLSVLNF